MAVRVVVPDMGQTSDELLLGTWRVSVGDRVASGDILAEIETDKAVAELESHASGYVLALLADAGDTVVTGDTLVWIGEPGESVPGEEDAPSHEARPRGTAGVLAGSAPAEAGPAEARGLLATPAARTLARERSVDLSSLTGSGPQGCVVKRDLDRVAGETVVPLSPMRRAIATRLSASVREAPQFSVAVDIDMTNALARRQAAPAKVTVGDVVVKACADALRDCPAMDCRVEGEAIRYLGDANVGIAVSLEGGLVVPVLERADTLTLGEVAERSRGLIASAREGRLPAGVVAGLTVSNLGMYGVKWFTAIVNPPEAAILAVGAVEERLVLTEAGIVARPSVTVVLTCDHRAVDGALAAEFLGAVKRRLEEAEG